VSQRKCRASVTAAESEEYNVAVYITNQMTSDPGAALSFVADPKKPVGGNIIGHACQTRIMLRKGRGETRIARIYDSPDMPESEATFAITEKGITDVQEWLKLIRQWWIMKRHFHIYISTH